MPNFFRPRIDIPISSDPVEQLVAAISGDIEHARVMSQPHLNDEIRSAITGDIEHARIKAANHGNSMINNFLANLTASSGVASQNRYQVTIPCSLIGYNSTKIFNAIEAQKPGATWNWMQDWYDVDLPATAIELAAYCEKSELPSYQFQLETVRHYGPTFKIPHMPEYQDITMTFICGATMWERYFFDAWMYLVMDPYTNDFNYKDEYAVDIIITSYIPGGDIVDADMNYWTKLIDAFPVAINVQELGYDLNNSIQKVQVTFSYKFAVPFDDKGSTTGMKPRGQQSTFGDTIGPPVQH